MTNDKSVKITSLDIFFYFRQRLLDAQAQKDIDTLRNLAIVFDMLWDLADKKKIQGGIFRILENLENSAQDSVEGVDWKSIIPSEEEIKSVLYNG